MEKWEYIAKFVTANIETEGVDAYLNKRWPNWNKLPKSAPQAMIPELNDWGEEGWEVVHMEPVAPTRKNDVVIGGNMGSQTNIYFCVMKRRKE